jgi:hypothetical protein
MTHEDIQTTADLLKRLQPGFLPYPIFEQVARLVALPIVEFIPLRKGLDGATEVLLVARDADDPFWPNMLHTPGTVVRATDLHKGDQDDWQAFERILKDEMKGTKVGPPQYVGSIFHDSKRGAELAQIYWVEVLEEARVGVFYDITALPMQLMDSQIAFIVQAAADFNRIMENKKVQ